MRRGDTHRDGADGARSRRRTSTTLWDPSSSVVYVSFIAVLTAVPDTILMYHDVSSNRRGRFARFVVTPEAFARQMEYLAERDVRVCGVSEFAEARSKIDVPRKPLVGLTFDDAFRD